MNFGPHKNLILTILIAALAICGSLIYAGYQYRHGLDDAQLANRIDTVLADKIEKGIEAYIDKQRQAQQDARAAQAHAASEKAKNVRRVSKRDHVYGNPEAEISMIEYSDFECPYCKAFHATPKKLVDAFDGKVNLVYRHFPLPFHNPGAEKEAEASECANELGGNDAFWHYADLIYERTHSNGRGFPTDKLVPLAGEIGLDTGRFKTCLDSGKYAGRIQDDITEGSNSGINGTPGTILLNNKTGETHLKPGNLPFDILKSEIDQMLKINT